MLISKRRWGKVVDAVNQAHCDILKVAFQDGEMEHCPETWNDSTRELFDLLAEFQRKIEKGIAGALEIKD